LTTHLRVIFFILFETCLARGIQRGVQSDPAPRGGGGDICALKFITPTLTSVKILAEVDALLRLKGKPNIIEVNYICNDPLNEGKVGLAYMIMITR
jgi:hypothetical protein